jgi:hypothetical protein
MVNPEIYVTQHFQQTACQHAAATVTHIFSLRQECDEKVNPLYVIYKVNYQ